MKTLWNIVQTLSAVALLLLVMGCSGSSSTPMSVSADPSAAKEGQGGSDTLPQIIIDAVNQALPNGTIVAVTREKEKGKISYDVEVEVDGKMFEVEVAEDGTVLEVEEDDGDADDDDADDDDADDEVEVAVDQLPQAVKDAVAQAVPGGTIVEAEMETEDGQSVYDIQVEANGKEFDVEVAEDGTVLEVEEDDDGDDADDIDDDDFEEENQNGNDDDDDATEG